MPRLALVRLMILSLHLAPIAWLHSSWVIWVVLVHSFEIFLHITISEAGNAQVVGLVVAEAGILRDLRSHEIFMYLTRSKAGDTEGREKNCAMFRTSQQLYPLDSSESSY